jgi:hypothetical protein
VGNPRSNRWDVESIRPDRFYVWQESWIDEEEVYDEWIALGEDLYINAGLWMKVDVPARRELNEAFAIETFLGLLDTVPGDQCSAYKLKGRTFLGLNADGMPPQLYVDTDVEDSAPDLLEGATILWIDDASRLPAKIHARARYEEEGASVLVKFDQVFFDFDADISISAPEVDLEPIGEAPEETQPGPGRLLGRFRVKRTLSPLPPSPSRRRIGAIAVLASIAVLIARVVIAMSAGEREEGPSTMRPHEYVMIRDDFSDPASGWVEQRTKRVKAQYVDGVYRVSLTPPEFTWRRFLSGSPVRGISVEADVLPVGGVAGIVCSVSEASGNSYAFLVRAETDSYEIVKTTNWNRHHAIAEGYNRAIFKSATNHIRGECVAGTSGEPTNLTMWVNGSQVAHVEDLTGFASFDAMGMIVFSLRMGHIHADFDNAVARTAS